MSKEINPLEITDVSGNGEPFEFRELKHKYCYFVTFVLVFGLLTGCIIFVTFLSNTVCITFSKDICVVYCVFSFMIFCSLFSMLSLYIVSFAIYEGDGTDRRDMRFHQRTLCQSGSLKPFNYRLLIIMFVFTIIGVLGSFTMSFNFSITNAELHDYEETQKITNVSVTDVSTCVSQGIRWFSFRDGVTHLNTYVNYGLKIQKKHSFSYKYYVITPVTVNTTNTNLTSVSFFFGKKTDSSDWTIETLFNSQVSTAMLITDSEEWDTYQKAVDLFKILYKNVYSFHDNVIPVLFQTNPWDDEKIARERYSLIINCFLIFIVVYNFNIVLYLIHLLKA